MLQPGATILVFGLFLLGRGLLDVFRSEAVATANRGLNARRVRENVHSGRRHAESSTEVRRQGRNVLWFSAATITVGIAVMILSGGLN